MEEAKVAIRADEAVHVAVAVFQFFRGVHQNLEQLQAWSKL
jgi:hypothetical protein